MNLPSTKTARNSVDHDPGLPGHCGRAFDYRREIGHYQSPRNATFGWNAQAQLLVESGMERAAAQLAADADYSGETWKIPAEESWRQTMPDL